MISLLYLFALKAGYLAMWISSIWNPKNRQWIKGRKKLFIKLKTDFLTENSPVVWVHCSSLGEFEQGRPVIEAIKQKYPSYKILLTFFSPSGYEIRKNYESADFIYYLPLDGPLSSKRFVQIVRPKLAIFVKYDYWYYYYYYLKAGNIPLFVLSGLFRKGQVFFKPYGGFFRKMLQCVTHFFVQDQQSAQFLSNFGFNNATVINDTRIDRVYQIAESAKSSKLEIITAFKDSEFTLIAGSTYKTEEEFINKLIESGKIQGKTIIAPHQIDVNHTRQIKDLFGTSSLMWSEAQKIDKSELAKYRVMVIDTIGLLAFLYKYGDLAFVGGGFGKSIHNILEPATFGLPIITGPENHENFREAVDLVKLGGAFIVKNYKEFQETYLSLLENEKRGKASKMCSKYIKSHTGGTERFMGEIDKWI